VKQGVIWTKQEHRKVCRRVVMSGRNSFSARYTNVRRLHTTVALFEVEELHGSTWALKTKKWSSIPG